MRTDCSGLLLVDVVLVDLGLINLALIDLTLINLALPHGEAFPVGIGEAIHAVHPFSSSKV